MDEPKLQAPEWPITYDIHTEGDGGELAKRDDLLIGCVIGTVARGNGSKYPKIFADVICERPNALICRTVNDRAVIFCPLENDGGRARWVSFKAAALWRTARQLCQMAS